MDRKQYAKRGSSVRELPSGRWQARYYDDRGTRRTKTFRLKSDALKFLRGAVVDIDRGDYINPDKAAMTFAEVAEEWIATKVKRPKTMAGYRSLLATHLLPTFADRPVSTIETTDVRKWLAMMQRAGKAPGTIRNAYRVLTPIMRTAIELKCRKDDPCIPIRLRDDLPRSRQTEMLFLDAAEVVRLADAMPEPWAVLVHFAARTGMRAGEINALRMRNVDLLRNKIHVKESISEVEGVQHFVPPKTGEDRTIAIPPTLSRMLRTYLDGQPQKGPADFLFASPEDRHAPIAYTRWFYVKVYKPAVRRAGLNPALRFHDLRHTCASLLITADPPVGPKVVQRHLGHSSFAITYDRYGHLYKDVADQQVSDALEAAFG